MTIEKKKPRVQKVHLSVLLIASAPPSECFIN